MKRFILIVSAAIVLAGCGDMNHTSPARAVAVKPAVSLPFHPPFVGVAQWQPSGTDKHYMAIDADGSLWNLSNTTGWTLLSPGPGPSDPSRIVQLAGPNNWPGPLVGLSADGNVYSYIGCCPAWGLLTQ